MSTPHIHAELMRQWAEDNAVVPPLHKWQCRSKSNKKGLWDAVQTPGWHADMDYRRVVKAEPHPHAELILQWAQDNQTTPPAYEWEVQVDNSHADWEPLGVFKPAWHSSNMYRRIKK